MQQRTWHVLIFWGKYDELTPGFAPQIKDPTAKFLKLYVRVVNSIHFMQNGDENRVKIRSDNFLEKLARNLFLGAICSSWPDAPFAPICSTRSKNKLVEISQNYLVIFSENSRYVTSNACNFLKKIFWCLFVSADCSPWPDASFAPIFKVCSQKLKILWLKIWRV